MNLMFAHGDDDDYDGDGDGDCAGDVWLVMANDRTIKQVVS